MGEHEQALQERDNLLKQLSLRQEEQDKQVLQALQQAMHVLLSAQQVLTSDLRYHQSFRQAQDFGKLMEMGSPFEAAGQNDGQIPPWLHRQPPDLQ
ncbi:MAG: hypothetical protein NUK65_12635 [Firmicutes bacterium]|nr:hypothetical protein [Bacillota bacterium]